MNRIADCAATTAARDRLAAAALVCKRDMVVLCHRTLGPTHPTTVRVVLELADMHAAAFARSLARGGVS